MNQAYSIELAEGAEALGLPEMLKDLIGQNLDQNPGKVKDFAKLKIHIGLFIQDADIRMTLVFNKGILTLYPGILGSVQITIETDAETVMALSNQTIKWGLPYYFDETGREIFSAIKTGRLKVKGMIPHFPSMIRFSRVMSVR
jgi:hypothetical protein